MNERIKVVQLASAAAPMAAAEPEDHSRIASGRRVSLNFALSLEDGSDVENNLDAEPLHCVIGDGSLLPGLEAALQGLQAGAFFDAELAPEQAFGPFNEDNVQRFPLYQFPPDLVLSEGLMVDFADPSGYSQAGIVRSFDARYVTIDFNHPLAGRTLRFRVVIHSVA